MPRVYVLELEDVIKHAQTNGFKSDPDSRMLYMLAAEIQRLRAHVADEHRLPPEDQAFSDGKPPPEFGDLALQAANELDGDGDIPAVREFGRLLASSVGNLPDLEELKAFIAFFEALGIPRASSLTQARIDWDAAAQRLANTKRPGPDDALKLRRAFLRLHGDLLDIMEEHRLQSEY